MKNLPPIRSILLSLGAFGLLSGFSLFGQAPTQAIPSIDSAGTLLAVTQALEKLTINAVLGILVYYLAKRNEGKDKEIATMYGANIETLKGSVKDNTIGFSKLETSNEALIVKFTELSNDLKNLTRAIYSQNGKGPHNDDRHAGPGS
ncbi:MAG: hypothetical protein IT581_12135 [Verrucomicrobiales bacterium]|nr:hypothetical protein [Verrucomicrobiales bacterium]